MAILLSLLIVSSPPNLCEDLSVELTWAVEEDLLTPEEARQIVANCNQLPT